MKRSRLFAAAAAMAVLAVIGKVYVGKRQASALEVVHPQRGPAVHAVYATGTVEPTVMLPVSPRVTARLMTLNADEGQQVKKGDVLAQLEDSDVQSGIAELRAKEVLAAQELKRTERLSATGSISRAEADQSRA
ncbi:MAG: biotin/lipoyl-binding protein, partial [Alphaproteobacteria bacterium]|nr:biotin/lipoyl-binding protein [Alphaproteobacteria bacterium]